MNFEKELDDLITWACEKEEKRGGDISSFVNEKEFMKRKDYNWDIDNISFNSNLTYPMIEILKEREDFDWETISMNCNVDMEMMKSHPHNPWDIFWVLNSTKLDDKVFDEFKEIVHFYQAISGNKFLTSEIILKYPSYSYDLLLIRNLLTYEMKDMFLGTDFWRYLSMSEKLSMDKVGKNIDHPWDWESISINPNISIEKVLEYPSLPWNWKSLSASINMKDIEKNPSLPWVKNSFRYNQTLGENDCIKSKELWGLSFGFKINLQFIKDNEDFPWNFGGLSYNKHLTTEIVEYYIKKDWDWDKLSYTLPLEYIIKNKKLNWSWNHVFNWEEISERKAIYLNRKYFIYFVGKRITNRYSNSAVSVKRSVGKRTIYRNYTNQ